VPTGTLPGVHLGRRLLARSPLLLVASALTVVLVFTVVPACTKQAADPDPNGRRSVYVLAKAMPVGMLVATARATGVMELRSLPADVAGTDAISDTAGLECLVVGQSLPAGTVVRRNQLVTPDSIGLNRGLTGGTGPRPEGC
jgi:hypothetical protein